MNLENIPVFRALGERADYLKHRQEVITSNVANANTPDYKAKRLEAFSFERAVSEPDVHMAATRSDHIAGDRASAGRGEVVEAETREMAPNGNTVVLEEQLKNAAETRVQHRMTQDLFRKSHQMLTTVLGKR